MGGGSQPLLFFNIAEASLGRLRHPPQRVQIVYRLVICWSMFIDRLKLRKPPLSALSGLSYNVGHGRRCNVLLFVGAGYR